MFSPAPCAPQPVMIGVRDWCEKSPVAAMCSDHVTAKVCAQPDTFSGARPAAARSLFTMPAIWVAIATAGAMTVAAGAAGAAGVAGATGPATDAAAAAAVPWYAVDFHG